MAQEASFIHTSDLHLNGNKDRFEVLSNIVSLCLKRKVDALLIAGDLFDKNASRKTVYLAYKKLDLLKDEGVRVFLIKGDEDARVKLSKIPLHIKLLKNKGVNSFSLKNRPIGLYHGLINNHMAKSKFDYFALGHFHDCTRINAHCYYSGSPIPSLKYKIKQRYVILVTFKGKKIKPIRIKL